ncbi:MAG TPA: prephenate dehydrogenase [bacterium]|nr:prephenate dehydrogenase [bacterium]
MKIGKKIAIIGMGLLGGSIGKALISRKLAGTVVGVVRRPEAVTQVVKARSAHLATCDIAEGVRNADLVILAVPVEEMSELARRILPYIEKNTVITDVGSVKANVVSRLGKIFARKGIFVGSHPMAGKEKGGLAHADSGLFRDAITIVTPTAKTSPRAVEAVRLLWESLGSRIVILPPADHDRAVAAVSHLPHIVSVALMNAASGARTSQVDPFECIGPSFRDMTRVVSSPADMWAGILVSNKKEVVRVAKRFADEVQRMVSAVSRGDRRAVTALFDRARSTKDTMNGRNHA